MWNEVMGSIYTHVNLAQRSFMKQQENILLENLFNDIRIRYLSIPQEFYDFKVSWAVFIHDLYSTGEVRLENYAFPEFMVFFANEYYQRLPQMHSDVFIRFLLTVFYTEKRSYFEYLRQKSRSN